MRKQIFAIILVALSTMMFAQAPETFNYQAVVRNSTGGVIGNQEVNLRISILSGTIDGASVYSETHTVTTDSYGIVTLNIGKGTTGNNFSSIDWGNNIYFLKTEIDETGGTDFKLMGTTQLLSVPYALYANSAGNGFSGEFDDLIGTPDFTLWDKDSTDNVNIFGNQTIAGNKTFTGTISANDEIVKNVATPVEPSDAVNKEYVDSKTNFSVSATGDTLFLGDFFVIIDGISSSNNGYITNVPEITWSKVVVGDSSEMTGWNYIAFGNNTFVAVTDNGCASTNNAAYVSADMGLTWTKKSTPGSTDMYGIAFTPNGNRFVVSFRCWEQTRNHAYSDDNGNTWTPLLHNPHEYASYRYNIFKLKDYFLLFNLFKLM